MCINACFICIHDLRFALHVVWEMIFVLLRLKKGKSVPPSRNPPDTPKGTGLKIGNYDVERKKKLDEERQEEYNQLLLQVSYKHIVMYPLVGGTQSL